MAQDLMRFHSKDKFEVFVYATSPPDDPAFLAQVGSLCDCDRAVGWLVGINNVDNTVFNTIVML